jgi:hypothetical protein
MSEISSMGNNPADAVAAAINDGKTHLLLAAVFLSDSNRLITVLLTIIYRVALSLPSKYH